MSEHLVKEYKSIQSIKTGDKGFRELAKDCVCLANAQGGEIYIGFENRIQQPPLHQEISYAEINNTVKKLRSMAFSVSLLHSDILAHENGGQYFIITIEPSLQSTATTSDGKIYIRVGEECVPARSEDIHRIAAEKHAFQWELVVHQSIVLKDINPDEVMQFVSDIRSSDKVKNFIKTKSDVEILEHYNLVDNNSPTNLGILWLGYPKQLLLDIESKATELKYFHEFPDGLFRKRVRHYSDKVIRELLVNAVAHHSFTISSDITVEVYPDRLEISNPGGLPIGINKNNILHQKHRRNPHFINIFHDLGLMEGEGSGFDMIYEELSR